MHDKIPDPDPKPMKCYRLTVDFTSEYSLTTWEYDISDPAEFFKTAIEDVDPDKVTSFSLLRLDERGKPIKQPKVYTVGQQ